MLTFPSGLRHLLNFRSQAQLFGSSVMATSFLIVVRIIRPMGERATVLILSVGVDDDKVDTYDAQLIEMYKEKYPVEEGPVPAIRFKGLKDIFMSNPDSSHSFNESWVRRSHAFDFNCGKLLREEFSS